MTRELRSTIAPALVIVAMLATILDTEAVPSPLDPHPIVTIARLEDTNGDQDGFLDTNETATLHINFAYKVTFRFLVPNPAVATVYGAVVRLVPADPKIDFISPSLIYLPDLETGVPIPLPPVTVHVSAAASRSGPSVVCQNPGPLGACSNFVVVPGGCANDAQCARTTTDDYSTRIEIEVFRGGWVNFSMSPYFSGFTNLITETVVLPLDLDLNSTYPAQATSTFVEGFETGVGSFTFMNLDAGVASNSASNGTRCQYSDPDFSNSNTYGNTACYLGFAAGQLPVNDWHSHGTGSVDGGRAYLGTRSFHYGIHTPGNPGMDTYGLSQMDAIRTKAFVNLAARVCQNDPALDKRACTTASDCVVAGGGPCTPATPRWTFKQQIALPDDSPYLAFGMAGDRAVVAAQLLGGAPWQKLYPFENVYDLQANLHGSPLCTFDPTDDGNDEDDFFDPSDPERLFGPSSTCYPEFAFARLGDTDEPYSPTNIRFASDGPGLPGSLGVGTWVESKINLSRYRGRSIRIRYLVTSQKVFDTSTLEALFMWNPSSADDGWYINDVRVTQTLGATTPTVSNDAADNSSLPGAMDTDGDGRPDDFDCAPLDGGAFAIPVEVFGGAFAMDKVKFSWGASAAIESGSAAVYDVLRGEIGQWPVGSGAGETCIEPGTAGSSTTDTEIPDAGTGRFYLVRARNQCGAGNYGRDSSGADRISAACP